MSLRPGPEDAEAETVADRIRAVIRSLPPKDGRRARIDHISIDDFAELLGAKRSRVITWTKGRGYPNEQYQQRLADLSAGRYTPDDFRKPDLSVLEPELREQVRELRDLLEAVVALVDRQWQVVERQTDLVLKFAAAVQETVDLDSAARAMREGIDDLREGDVAESQDRLRRLRSELRRWRRAQ